MVEIDINELNKFKEFDLKFDNLIHCDLKDFFDEVQKINIQKFCNKHDDWVNQINQWQETFNAFDGRKSLSTTQVNPYNFIDRISDNLKENSKVIIDTGCSIAWFMQSMRIPETVRVFHDCNNTAMGWALPASIGGYYADLGKSPIITIVGDGGFMMTSYELATAMHNNIPLKIFIMNNQGYSMIQQTQDQWLDSNYYASSNQGGISFPDFRKLSKAYNFKYFDVILFIV